MSYYASISGNSMALSIDEGRGGDGRQKTLPIGTRLLEFVYYDLKKLSDRLDVVFTLATSIREIDAVRIFRRIDEENSYLRFFAELLMDTLVEGSWTTKKGFDSLCNTYPGEAKVLREHPSFAKVNYKSKDKRFLIAMFSLHAMAMQGFLKAQLEFCMDSTSDGALQDLAPAQRLYLYEQWRKSKGEQPVYFECETYSLRMRMDKSVVLPEGGTLNEWAAILKQENPVITEMTELPNGYALMRYEMMHMVMQDVPIKRCAHCNRYFINTGRSDKAYCTRPVDDQPGKTCEDVGALIKFQNKAKNSHVIREFNTAYKRANSNKRIGNLTEKEFEAWSREAREKRDLCLAGKLSPEDFFAWLNQDRIYRKRG